MTLAAVAALAVAVLAGCAAPAPAPAPVADGQQATVESVESEVEAPVEAAAPPAELVEGDLPIGAAGILTGLTRYKDETTAVENFDIWIRKGAVAVWILDGRTGEVREWVEDGWSVDPAVATLLSERDYGDPFWSTPVDDVAKDAAVFSLGRSFNQGLTDFAYAVVYVVPTGDSVTSPYVHKG